VVAVQVVLGVAVVALLIFRQLRTRPVNAAGLRVVLILGIIGVAEAVPYLQHNHAGAETYAALGGSLVLAAAFGALRAATVRVWLQGGQPWSKGNWLTGALWVLAVATHLGYDFLVSHGHPGHDVGTATIVLYLAVSLGVQRLITQQRAQRLQASCPAASGHPGNRTLT
jgi:hypothetical protein